MAQIVQLKRWKAEVQQMYNAAQMFLTQDQFKLVQQQVKTIVDKLKQNEIEVLKFTKTKISNMYRSIKL